jgi:hypothetical protein
LIAVERRWRLRCLLGWEPCSIKDVPVADDVESWVVCATCGKRRLLLFKLSDL